MADKSFMLGRKHTRHGVDVFWHGLEAEEDVQWTIPTLGDAEFVAKRAHHPDEEVEDNATDGGVGEEVHKI